MAPASPLARSVRVVISFPFALSLDSAPRAHIPRPERVGEPLSARQGALVPSSYPERREAAEIQQCPTEIPGGDSATAGSRTCCVVFLSSAAGWPDLTDGSQARRGWPQPARSDAVRTRHRQPLPAPRCGYAPKIRPNGIARGDLAPDVTDGLRAR